MANEGDRPKETEARDATEREGCNGQRCDAVAVV